MEERASGRAVPVRDRAVAPRGLPLHYRDWGDPSARPLVLLHGGTGNARHWDTVARLLSDQHRVLALDLRGHGESGHAPEGDYAPEAVVEDVAGFADALGLGRFALAGFSIGGHAAYAYAAGHPGRVERLVLVEAFIPPDTPENRAQLDAWRAMAGSVFGDPEEAVAAFAAAGFAPRASVEERRHWVRTGLKRRADGRWVWRRDPALLRPPPPGSPRFIPPPEAMWRLLGRVACPTLIVRGAETVAFALEEAERMAAAVPDARAVTLADAGHWTPLDNPAGFAALLRDFLAEG